MSFRPNCQKFPDCGYKHFSHEPCGSGSGKKKREKQAVKKKSKVPVKKQKISKPVISATQAKRNKRYRQKHSEAHKKYQRELMRKRREKEAEK